MTGDYTVNDASDPWYHYRNIIGVPSRRRIICGIVLIVLVLTLVAISFAILSKRNNPTSQDKDTLKDASLQSAFDPCMDFYNYSCSSWAVENPLPPNTARITTFSLLQDAVNKDKREIFENTKVDEDLPRVVNDALRFYNICIFHNSTVNSDKQLLLKYLDQMGGWPILNRYKWDENAFDWVQSSTFLIKHSDLHTVIGVYSIDDKKGSKNIIYLKPPNILQDEEAILNNMASFRMLYVILNSLNDSNIHSDVMDDIEGLKVAETRWHKLLSVSHKISEPLLLSIEELTQQIPQVDWLNYLQLITNDTLYEINETLTVNDTVAVDNLDYLKNVISVLNSGAFSKLELANLFGWFAVKDIWILIPDVLQNYANISAYDTEDMQTAASEKCYDLVLELFPCSLDFLYVKNSSHLKIHDSIVLTSYLKSAFQDVINTSQWLDKVTKDAVLNRLNNMKDIIGFPNYLNNKTEFDKIYEDFPLMNDVGLKYYFKILQYYVMMRILYLKDPISQLSSILPRPVSDVSAYYMVNKNALVYPVSFYYPPFYSFQTAWYYGAAGSVIGHEMMHGFDNFGNEGNVLKTAWFHDISRTSYQKRAKCFKNQYTIYDRSGMCENNGTRTLRENIADSEGLRLAFRAYKNHVKDIRQKELLHHNITITVLMSDNLSPDQMFFIGYGSVWCSKMSPQMRKAMVTGSHSLPEVRVNKAVSNSESFALAFNCPEGSPMNPLKKCSIW